MTCDAPPNIVLLRFGELTLKSEGVRRHFLNLLVQHIRSLLGPHGIKDYQSEPRRNRIFIHSPLAEKIITKMINMKKVLLLFIILLLFLHYFFTAVQSQQFCNIILPVTIDRNLKSYTFNRNFFIRIQYKLDHFIFQRVYLVDFTLL